MNFNQQVVWITGASSGIGEALAQAFAQAGASLILSARRIEELERVKNSLPLSPAQVLVLPIDLEKPETFPELVQQVMDAFNRIDILVHNGGISQRGLVKASPLALDQKIMAVNYFGAVALTKAVLPIMLAQKSGRVVVISSLVGKFGTPMRSAYAASKHALHGFFDSLRSEVWRDNIRVTIVCPGYIRTNISINALTEKGDKHNRMDKNQEKGMAPERCATLILKAVAANKEEVVIGGKEILAVYLKRFFPGLLSWALKRFMKPA
ncbi:SDR family oxidoreductase [Adhaeribacter rhizoryzae]|uniref:SDR family oxidoreductase n=1 Tax=Adhaeribacter rhizoryzae TaxID=2607907 RepID=UPI0029393345|nr:SDR family oxidoreductase [Adhaeribacter rhizoryzae]